MKQNLKQKSMPRSTNSVILKMVRDRSSRPRLVKCCKRVLRTPGRPYNPQQRWRLPGNAWQAHRSRRNNRLAHETNQSAKQRWRPLSKAGLKAVSKPSRSGNTSFLVCKPDNVRFCTMAVPLFGKSKNCTTQAPL